MQSTMTREQVIEKLCVLAAEQVGVDASVVTIETHLFDDLNFDSLDIVEYAMTIEEEFDVEVPDEKAQEVKTIRQAHELLSVARG